MGLENALGALALDSTLQAIIKDEDAPHTSGDKGIMALAVRQDADTNGAGDGDYTALKMDEQGRLKVSTKPASISPITGDISAVQATIGTPVANATVIADVSRASNVVMFCYGTFAGVNVSFEASLEPTGERWFSIQAVRSNANTIETATGALSAQPVYSWEMSVNAYSRVRVRCTARTSGTQSWIIQPGTYATEPIPAAQASATQPVSGTVTANITHPNPTASIINSAANTNATIIKASAGNLYSITISNTNAAVRYVKLHNSTTVTPGSTAVALTIPVPAGAVINISFGATGMRFGTGISLSITANAADADATGVAAGEIKVLTSFI